MSARNKRTQWVRKVADRALSSGGDLQKRGWRWLDSSEGPPSDYLVALDREPDLNYAFDRLRWGGQLICITADRKRAQSLAQRVRDTAGFNVDVDPGVVRTGPRFIPGIGRKLHYTVARKTFLVRPDQHTMRFTYDVRLERHRRSEHEYAVLKQVPSRQSVMRRLRQRFPDSDGEQLQKQAKKLADHVFPVFLSREVSFLRVLERHAPEEYKGRFPRILGAEKDDQGLVRKVLMSWLRQGGPPLSQLEFAKQSAELLQVIHEKARITHLDMRLDNLLITPRGVAIVDFGSAVRDDEDFKETGMLRQLFDQLMSTSEIQQTIGKMVKSGRVTSSAIVNAHQKIDKTADLFYLALQCAHIHEHPPFEGLIDYDPESEEAQAVEEVRREVMRPSDPENPSITSAGEFRRRLEELDGARIG